MVLGFSTLLRGIRISRGGWGLESRVTLRCKDALKFLGVLGQRSLGLNLISSKDSCFLSLLVPKTILYKALGATLSPGGFGLRLQG